MSTKLYLKRKRFQLLLIVFLALHPFFRITTLATAQGVPLQLYEVKTTHTRKLGMNSPKGMTFVPGEQSFLVWGDTSSVTMTIYGDPGIPVDVADLIENPLGTAFDQRSDSLFFLTANGTELAKIEREEIGLPKSSRQTVTRFHAGAFDLQDVQGMTFDPHTGQLFILDARKSQILIISPHPTLGFDSGNAVMSGGINRIDLASFIRSAPRGIAFNPNNGNVYVGSPTEQKIYELTGEGKVISVSDISPFLLRNLSTMLFAPSSDQTDDLLKESLYLVDSGNVGTAESRTSYMPHNGNLIADQAVTEENEGRILELSLTEPLALPPGVALLPSTLVQVIDTSNTVWNPSSPDPSGIDYWPLTGRLLLADSEVDEMPRYFTGNNVFDSTLSGELISTCSTTNLSHTGFSNEPSGLGIDPGNNRIYFSDDNLNRIIEVGLGADGIYCTSDDVVTFVNVLDLYNISDAEDVAYGQNTIFIAGGINAEVYMFNLGADGKLGGDDGPMAHFDTRAWGFGDLEGIGYNVDQGTLFIVSSDGSDNYVGHITTSGTLINAYDLSFMGNIPNIRSDVAFAPGSQNPAVKNIYIVSRGMDNDYESQENDGKIWEIALAPTFTDVPFTHMFSKYIEAFHGAGITTGCLQSPKKYCPDANVTRGEMAVFIERAMGNYAPTPNPTGMFTDLPYPGLESFTPFIEEFYNDGITVGCALNPLKYCPQNYVTRGEMAVFLERAMGNFTPTPNPTGIFADVPYPGQPPSFQAFIEELYNDGITAGCAINPLRYCPQNYVTRGEMAVFIVRAFGIPVP